MDVETVLLVSKRGEEELPDCSKMNLVYENICTDCNPGASKKGEQEDIRTDIPTTYIGETSRSIYERSKEHWEGARKGCLKNHMVKHQLLEHGGEQKPNFFMRIRGHYKTALARQVADAVMIRRRGGGSNRGGSNRHAFQGSSVNKGEHRRTTSKV